MMKSLSKLVLKSVFSIGLILYVVTAQAISPIVIKKETPHHILDIKYPQGFQSAQVNLAIKNFIEASQHSFKIELQGEAVTPADAPGKNNLTIRYSIPYHTNNALSVRFDISIYHPGAAHPMNKVMVKNFIKDQPVILADLFVAGSNYLQRLAAFSKQAISAKKISDAHWIQEGTKASAKNYAVWHFSKNGLVILFNSYQVAAYVYGEQTVKVPLTVISPVLKPEILHAIWGH